MELLVLARFLIVVVILVLAVSARHLQNRSGRAHRSLRPRRNGDLTVSHDVPIK